MKPPPNHFASMLAAVPFLAAVCLFTRGLSAQETQVSRLVEQALTGKRPDEEARRVFRSLYDEWLESERSSTQPGDPALGRALKSLTEGNVPAEAEMAALASAYFRGRRAQEPEHQPQAPLRPDAIPRPVSSRPLHSTTSHSLAGLLLAFILGTSMGLLAFLIWQRMRAP